MVPKNLPDCFICPLVSAGVPEFGANASRDPRHALHGDTQRLRPQRGLFYQLRDVWFQRRFG